MNWKQDLEVNWCSSSPGNPIPLGVEVKGITDSGIIISGRFVLENNGPVFKSKSIEHARLAKAIIRWMPLSVWNSIIYDSRSNLQCN